MDNANEVWPFPFSSFIGIDSISGIWCVRVCTLLAVDLKDTAYTSIMGELIIRWPKHFLNVCGDAATRFPALIVIHTLSRTHRIHMFRIYV